jgi:hypothetical protein
MREERLRNGITALTLGFLLTVVPGSAMAESEPIILTIDGAVAGGVAVDFNRTQLEALGAATVTTTTPWHEGVPHFDGVLMSALLQHVKATGGIAELHALNDYQTSIPVSDFSRYPVILALKQDGEYMSVRNKGPLFIIYPFDEFEELQNDLYYSRSIWQLRRITIK